jgi:hypothetical protein
MKFDYASIDEVWCDAKNKKSSGSKNNKTDPACALYKRRKGGYNKVYDDIIDTYLDDCGPSKDPNKPYEGLLSSSLAMNGRSIAADDDQFDDMKFAPQQRQVLETTKREPCNNREPVESIASSAYENSMGYDRFFDDDNMFQQKQSQQSQQSQLNFNRARSPLQEEQSNYDPQTAELDDGPQQRIQSNYIQEETYDNNDYLRTYTPESNSSLHNYNYWIELFLFVVSGIILIFVLEQVLQMGMYLR